MMLIGLSFNRELLARAYPTEIGEIRGQNVEKVKAFLRRMFPRRDFHIVTTAQDGDIKLRTRKDPFDLAPYNSVPFHYLRGETHAIESANKK